jgi:SAM-dependent methyltransferase
MASAAGDIVALYERHARSWDKARVKTLFERPWLDRFRALMPASGGTILDLGCGSGEPLARHFIGTGYDVTGADSSTTMIALCQERFPQHEWIIADMRTLALGRRFNGILTWDSFFHLNHDDQRHMFPIFAGHAAKDAPLMFTSGPTHGESVGSYRGDPLYHASLDEAEYCALVDRNGFALVSHVVEDPCCGGRTVWLARRR